VTEAELQAHVDGQLPAARQAEIEAYLAQRPEEAQRVAAYRAQRQALRRLFDPVLDEPLPARVLRAARPLPARRPAWAQRIAAGVAIALLGGAAGWGLRGAAGGPGPLAWQGAGVRDVGPVLAHAAPNDFARRAAVAHTVYSPEQRRPVEVDAAHEAQLVAWLSRRLGQPLRPPQLQALGYALEGGRLLPGGQGPVAQFMYRRDGADAQAQGPGAASRLTLYVSNDVRDLGSAAAGGGAAAGTVFRFASEGAVNVFYWVDGPFGYALSAEADRAELARISAEVYRQLAPPAGR
jgi:anti-sigma factor RsiW